MEKTIVETLLHSIEANIPVALVSVTGSSGSSPGKVGAMMVVGPEGSICGTVGGGTLEQQTITEAIACLGSAKSRELSYRLAEGDLEMSCGGDIRLFIKVFAAQPQLYIVGGGHIGFELYKLASYQGFTCLVFDDRPDYVNQERFPLAQLVISEDIPPLYN
jgi:xanthine dehydrogenase accessory factor